MPFLDFDTDESYDLDMMPRVLMAFVLVAAIAGVGEAQSLADVAKAEAARRKTVDAPVKTYTNDDLRSDFSKPTPAPASTPAAPAEAAAKPATAAGETGKPAAAAAPARDQAYWSTRMTEARAKLERSRAFAQALQNRVDMLWTDFVNRGDPVQQRAIEQDRNKALAELEGLKKEIDENTAAIAQIEDEARRAGVPAGWLR
jgi:type IV secretory pathway VirB10-like protein